MTDLEYREQYPEIYHDGFNALEWARDGGNRHPSVADGFDLSSGKPVRFDVFFWGFGQVPSEVWAELQQPARYPTWSEAMSALVRAARSAHAKGWRL